MAAKLRHAAKTEHHKFEFDEETGSVRNKEEGMHSKGISEKEYLIELMSRKDFAEFMLKAY